MTPEPEQLEQLIHAIDGVTTEVSELRAQSAEQGELLSAARTVGKRGFVVGVVGIIVGALGFIVGANGFAAANKAQEAATKAQVAIDASDSQRAENKIASCGKDNENRALFRAGWEQNAVSWEQYRDQALGSIERTPEILAMIEQFNHNVVDPFRFLESALPDRDCSPAGIEAFLTTSTTTPG